MQHGNQVDRLPYILQYNINVRQESAVAIILQSI